MGRPGVGPCPVPRAAQRPHRSIRCPGRQRPRPGGATGLDRPPTDLVEWWATAVARRRAGRRTTRLLGSRIRVDPAIAKALRVSSAMRVLSGIQPSGTLHIGNYFGAIRQYVALQEENDAFYFVADYHALTSVRDPERLRGYVFDVLVDLLALGLDPGRAPLFVQSDVPETVELAWLLTSVTPMGWLGKSVSNKAKIQQGLPAEHGLFAYPVLQAADILLYDAYKVPVAQDQKQHLEI